MKRVAACVIVVSSACVEVISLTTPRGDARVESDATSLCSLIQQDQALATWNITDATRCGDDWRRVRTCRVVVAVPTGETFASWCVAAFGRTAIEGAPASCGVRVAPSYARDGVLASGDHGYYVDSSGCVAITDEPGGWRTGLSGRLECVVSEAVTTGPSTCALRALGASCAVGAVTSCTSDDAGRACADTSITLARAVSHECATGVCLASQDAGACSCRCALASDVDAGRSPLCVCPSGFECAAELEHPSMSEDLRGRYCVRVR